MMHEARQSVHYASAVMVIDRNADTRFTRWGPSSAHAVAFLLAALGMTSCSKDKDKEGVARQSQQAPQGGAPSPTSPQKAAAESPPQDEASGGPDPSCTLPFQEGTAPQGYKGVLASASRAKACAACESG